MKQRLYHKRKETLTAIQACDYALDLDGQCDKALLLRAQVRLAPKSAGATEQDLAYRDAINARKILQSKLLSLDDRIKSTAKRIPRVVKSSELFEQNSNKTIHSNEDEEDESKLLELGADGAFDLDLASSSCKGEEKDNENSFEYDEADVNVIEKKQVLKRCREVTKYVLTLKTDKIKQRDLDKEWTGVFDKGPICEDYMTPTSELKDKQKEEAVETSLVNQLTDAQRLLQMYEQNNMHEDADRIRKEVEQTKKNFEK